MKSTGIYPKRLTEARLSRGYNISELAEKIGVTRQAISKYEQGQSSPSELVLSKICCALEFPLSYFYKPNRSNLVEGTVFYRSLKSADAKVRSEIKTKCDWTSEIFEFLEEYLVLPSLNIPDLDLLISHGEYTFEKINGISKAVRNYWKLGNFPIDNLTYILEKNGFIISGASVGYEKAEACSEVINGRPVFFLGQGDRSACRIRFSLAHELGHMLLHGHITKDDIKDATVLKRIETEANWFAGAFLLPDSSFTQDIKSISLNYFLSLKRKWKVSVAAMVYRCADLGLLDSDQVLTIRKQISYKRWTRIEPLDNEIQSEHPQLLKSAIKYLFGNNAISISDFVNTISLNISDLCEVCSASPNLFKIDNKDLDITLK